MNRAISKIEHAFMTMQNEQLPVFFSHCSEFDDDFYISMEKLLATLMTLDSPSKVQ